MGTARGPLVEIEIGDDPAAWAALGFTVDGDVARVGGVDLRLVGRSARGRGMVGWTLALDDEADVAGDLDGIPTRVVPPPDAPGGEGPASAPHANGVVAIDHVVVLTPDLDRTTAALDEAGIVARRTREAGRGRLQRFFRLGEVILEVVGPAVPAGEGPASFFGLALTVADIDATVDHLADRIGAAKPAVQPGRRIATLHTGDDVSVPIAVMSSEPTPGGGAGSDG
jgi:hypothetical protein